MAELAKTDRIGDGFPVRCRNHPEAEFLACMPDDFATYAPNGGCTRQCDHELSCGHICTKLCHWNDKDHLNYKCEEPCPRVHPECNHPCRLRCGQECGDCSEPVGELRLPCDHVLPKAYCFQVRDPSKARCKEKVVRQLVHCEHEHTMDCHKDE
ncbi:hypothetical protein BGZ73_005253 [Actinomortierella ambigua]|nr:hypothetical protein BGZ73_005253 [Actinomortierella ambigua]